MSILLKLGVGGTDLSRYPQIMRDVLYILDSAWWPEDVVITSTWDGEHKMGSLHYVYKAVDIRYPRVNKEAKIERIKAQLYSTCDVVLEKDHIHIEYDPKPKTGKEGGD